MSTCQITDNCGKRASITYCCPLDSTANIVAMHANLVALGATLASIAAAVLPLAAADHRDARTLSMPLPFKVVDAHVHLISTTNGIDYL